MSLEDKLAAVREAAAKRVPPERLAIMHRATEQLRNSGILDRVIKTGAQGARIHAERSERLASDAIGADSTRPCADECVSRLLVTLLPA